MKLYSNQHAFNPRRVRIYLAEKGLGDSVEIVEVDIAKGENLTPEFLAVNPLGLLPVLELDDGTRIPESMAICRYFETLHPEPPLFGGDDPLRAATIEQWQRHLELELALPAAFSFRHGHPFWEGRIEQIPAWAEHARLRAIERLDWLDQVVADRTWIAGESFSVADITGLCAVDFCKLSKVRIGEREHLARWYARVNERPGARA